MALLPGLSEILGGKQGRSSSISGVTPFQQSYFKDLFSRAQDASYSPSITPGMQLGREMASQYVGDVQPFIKGAQGAGSFLTNPGILSPDTNPYLAQTAQAAANPVLQALLQDILPQIRGGAVGAGGFGGSRQGISEGLAAQSALQQIGDQSAGIYSQAYGQGLGALGQGLSLAPQTATLGLLPSQIMQELGAQQFEDPTRRLSQFQGLLGSALQESRSTGRTATQPMLNLSFAMGGGGGGGGGVPLG